MIMRTILSVIIGSLLPVMSMAAVTMPDWAFPRRTIEWGRQMMKSSQSDQRLWGTLCVSKSMLDIDNDALPRVIGMVDSIAMAESDPDTKALMLVLESDLCSEVRYATSPYCATEVCADNDEEAQDSDSAKMRDLLLKAFVAATGNNTLGLYRESFTTDSVTATWIPDVKAFVTLRMMQRDSTFFASEINSYRQSLDPSGNASWFFNSYKATPRQLVSLILDGNGPQRAIPLYFYLNSVSTHNNFLEDKVLDDLDREFRNSWVSPFLGNYISNLRAINFTVGVDNESLYPDTPLGIKVSKQLPCKIRIDLYRRTSPDDVNADIKTCEKPYMSFDVDPGDTLVDIGSLKAGYYMGRVSAAPSDSLHIYQRAFSQFIELSPFRVYQLPCPDKKELLVLGPDGLPAGNIALSTRTPDGKARATSDTYGIATMPRSAHGWVYVHCQGAEIQTHTYLGKEYPGSKGPRIQSSVLTDLPVYRPGATVKGVIVVRNDTAVLKGHKPKCVVILPDASGEVKERIEVATTPSDEFGRSYFELHLPDDATPGTASVSVNGRYNSEFAIAQFKMPDLDFREVKSRGDKGNLTLTGTIVGPTGHGMPQVSVKGSVHYNGQNVPLPDCMTDSAGIFKVETLCIPEQRKYQEYGYVELNATAANGAFASWTGHAGLLYPAQIDLTMPAKPYGQQYYNADSILRVKAKANYTDGVPCPTSLVWHLVNELNGTIATGKVCDGTATIDLAPLDLPAVQALWLNISDTAGLCPGVSRNIQTASTVNMGPSSTPVLYTLQCAMTHDDSTKTLRARVYSSFNGKCTVVNTFDPSRPVSVMELKRGPNTLEFPANESEHGSTVTLIGVNNGRLYDLVLKGSVKATAHGDTLRIMSFRDHVQPGATEEWKITYGTGQPFALCASIVNARLKDFHYKGYLYIGRQSAWPKLSFYPGHSHDNHIFFRGVLADSCYNASARIGLPDWSISFGTTAVQVNGLRFDRSAKFATDMAGVKESAIMAEAAEDMAPADGESTADDAGTGGTISQAGLRDPRVYSGLWMPSITSPTGDTVTLKWDVPDANTTWNAYITAWQKNLASDRKELAIRAFRPVTVTCMAPRFLRVGDRAIMGISYRNLTDSVVTVTCRVGIENGTCSDTVLTLPGGGISTVQIPVSVNDTAALVLYGKAVAGIWADGERVSIPVLPSQCLVKESTNFSMDASDTAYTTAVRRPADYAPQAVSTVTVYTNPVKAARQSLKAAESDASNLPSTLLAIQASLGHKASFDELAKRQMPDGSFKWFNDAAEGDLNTTMAVLQWLEDYKDTHQLHRALEYVDTRVKTTQVSDHEYALMRTLYGQPLTLAGRAILDRTQQSILKEWKSYSTPLKAKSALILARCGNMAMARELIASLLEFGTPTPQRGLRFKNVSSLSDLATILQAINAVLPGSHTAKEAAQAILYDRRGINWGTPYRTALAVKALAGISFPDTDPGVTVNGIHVKELNKTLVLVSDSLTITKAPAVPLYGTVSTEDVKEITDVQPSGGDELKINRRLKLRGADNRLRDFDPAKKALKVGDRLVIQLEIITDKPMDHLVVTHPRSACFEPIDQHSGSQGWWRNSYCMQTLDTETVFFIKATGKGRTTIEYEVAVTHAGSFADGAAVVQSALFPELTAHSRGWSVDVRQY